MDTLFQLSLLAAFIAGMVALFAPCCITFLLPAYFANIFKEKKQVLLMTFIFSLGIFTIMLPVVLGAKALSMLFYRLHDQTYIIGGLFLLVVGFMALLGLKLPIPRITTTRKPGDPVSTYILGIFSGITSACCAPVLIGVMALSALSPTIISSLLVGFSYVLGMVAPLYLASLFIDKHNILEKPFFRKKITTLTLSSRAYPIFISNMVAFLAFASIGILTIFLSLSGNLAMREGEDSVARTIQSVAIRVTDMTSSVPFIDLVFVLVAGFLLYKFLQMVVKKNKKL